MYYARNFSRVYFDYELNYLIRYENIIMPTLEKTGYCFLGWKTNCLGDDTLYPAGQSLTLTDGEYFFVSVFVEADDVKYTVENYQQQEDGTYSDTPTEVQELYGTTNSTVTPAPMEYAGFEIPVAQTKVARVVAEFNIVVSAGFTMDTSMRIARKTASDFVKSLLIIDHLP